jgi:predicted nucleic acid-binding protein
VLALARQTRYQLPVLTDDLALRRRIERKGGVAVGTVGVLVRCQELGMSSVSQLEESIERLISCSSLHMSRPFRTFLRKLIRGLGFDSAPVWQHQRPLYATR